MTIKILDELLINKIAAGEVIERPSSVVKELLENAIDAGSSKITVKIAVGGIERIEIEDNGEGMSADEIPVAIQRHATSKIRSEEDLLNIHTMGFRGEAMPSIASISRMEIISKKSGLDGIKAVINGGKLEEISPHPAAPGTLLIVKDIFYNTPVRRNFLKSPVSENMQVHDVVSKLALSRPDISFSFSNDKKHYFKTPGNGNLRDAVIAIYGMEFAKNFIDISFEGDYYSIKGMVSRPEFRRVNRKNQIFFVNNRYIKSPILSRAIDQAYRGLLLAREYAGVILFLRMDSSDVDVNVHPQKTEVRFKDEKHLFSAVHRVIGDKVHNIQQALDTDVLIDDELPASRISNYSDSSFNYVEHAPFKKELYEQSMNFTYSRPEPSSLRASYEMEKPVSIINKDDISYRIIGQAFNSYILIEKDDILLLIDQHAAHERIMYNQIRSKSKNGSNQSQVLVFPITFDLSVSKIETVEANLNLFEELGFTIEFIGPGAMLIRSAPAGILGHELETVFELLEILEDGKQDGLIHKAYATVACKQAVKAGQILSEKEMAEIVRQLLQTDDYRNCPHGRPTILELDHNELDRRFKR